MTPAKTSFPGLVAACVVCAFVVFGATSAVHAANPCNPCAANPCAANPCAANPCAANPCAPAAAAELSDAEAAATYERIADGMRAAYAKSDLPVAVTYFRWKRYNKAPYVSETHGGRYVNNFANDVAKAYGAFEKAGVMLEGSVLAKDSFRVPPTNPCAANPCAANPCAANPCAANPCAANPCAEKNPCAANPCAANPCAANPCAAAGKEQPGPLFIMEKMQAGFSPETGDWRVLSSPAASLRVWIESDVGLDVSVVKEEVDADGTVLVTALLRRAGEPLGASDLPKGLTVTAVVRGDGGGAPVSLRDDGTGGDRVAGDGRFRGVIPVPSSPGPRQISAFASASSFQRAGVVALKVIRRVEQVAVADKEEPPREPKPMAAMELVLPLGGSILASGLLAFLALALIRRYGRTHTASLIRQAAAYSAPDGDGGLGTQAEIDAVVLAHIESRGGALAALPDEGPSDRPRIIVLDGMGMTAEKIKAASKGRARIERVPDAATLELRLKESPPAAILVVEPLPKVTFWALLRTLYGSTVALRCPTLRLVAAPDADSIRRCLDIGVSDVIALPVDPNSVLRRVRRAIEAGSVEVAVRGDAAAGELDWVTDRVRNWAIPLRMKGGNGASGTVIMVDVREDGFSVASSESAEAGTNVTFTADLFRSLQLGDVTAEIAQVRELGAEQELGYLWDLRYEQLDKVHRERIQLCYMGMLKRAA